jgi:hypothetical protein
VLSVPVATVAAHEQRSALGRLRRKQVPRGSKDNREPTTKQLAEGLTHLSEAVRELHQELGSIETKIKALSDE